MGSLVRFQLKTISFNSKLYFKYILLSFDFLFLKNKIRNDKNTLLAITPPSLYFVALHFKLSSLFYSIQLSEFFSYELPSADSDNMFVYNFHMLNSQQRFFLFVCRHPLHEESSPSLTSISELFLNAN